MTDLDALKEDLAYLRERGDLAAALTATTAELHRLIEEVERLRAAERDAEDAERGAAACDQIVALLDGFPVEAPCPEAARVAALLAEVDALRAGLANIEQIVRDGMAVARAEGVAEGERRVVAYLRRESYPCCNQCNNQLADYIERGEHRKEEK